jgi:hypothetical protein
VEGEARAAASGVPEAEGLLAFADALVGDDDLALGAARARLLQAVGSAGLVDAAAVVSNFERMVRIADATGIPLDAPLRVLAGDLGTDLGLQRYGSAANSPPLRPIGRLFSRFLRPLAHRALRLAGQAGRIRRRQRARG